MFCVLSMFILSYFLSSCKSFPHWVQPFDQLLCFTVTGLELFINFSLILSFSSVLIGTFRGFNTINEYLCPNADIFISGSSCTKTPRLNVVGEGDRNSLFIFFFFQFIQIWKKENCIFFKMTYSKLRCSPISCLVASSLQTG